MGGAPVSSEFPGGVDEMSHGELKTFSPPGVGSMAWQGHLGPFPRCSFKWAHVGGPKEAARSFLRHLWRDCLVSKGMQLGALACLASVSDRTKPTETARGVIRKLCRVATGGN